MKARKRTILPGVLSDCRDGTRASEWPGAESNADTENFSLLLYELSSLAVFRNKSRDFRRDMSAGRVRRRCKLLYGNDLARW